VPPTTATVVVCTKDRPTLLRRALPAIAAQTGSGLEVDLVIVEQGKRVAAEMCSELGIAATLLHDDGIGAARARNLGVRHARGDVVLFTDDDCEVPSSWALDHLRALDRERAGASFGVVEGLSRFGRTDATVPGSDPVARNATHHNGSPPWIVGHSANMATRRSIFLAVGGFDERLGPGSHGGYIGEDADLIARMLAQDVVLVSGVGEPVRHLDWRSDDEHRRNLVAYERGAGAWIGKLLRTRPRLGLHFFRARLDLLRVRLRWNPGFFSDPRVVLSSLTAFARGVLFGFRLSRWKLSDCNPVTVEKIEHSN
jgi:glycosyltransferase involved in cell wall biosynthesis